MSDGMSGTTCTNAVASSTAVKLNEHINTHSVMALAMAAPLTAKRMEGVTIAVVKFMPVKP